MYINYTCIQTHKHTQLQKDVNSINTQKKNTLLAMDLLSSTNKKRYHFSYKTKKIYIYVKK